MLGPAALKSITRARLLDARALLVKRRFDAAIYLSGYAVEVALKARIVKTLKWNGFPETNNDPRMKSFFEKLHDIADDVQRAKSLDFFGLVHAADEIDRWDLLVSSPKLKPWSFESRKHCELPSKESVTVGDCADQWDRGVAALEQDHCPPDE